MATTRASFAVVRYQARVLTARYRDVMVGDLRTVALLIGQAALIAWLCTLVWSEGAAHDEPKLHFVMCLSAVWFGAVGACREVVKERPILERERFFGLSLVAYVWSKITVQAALGLAQVIVFQAIVAFHLTLHGPLLLQTLAMWGATLCGVGLGLVASAFVTTQERAVGLIPLLILPQILFSKFAISRFTDLVELIEKLMPVRWAHRVFEEAARPEPEWAWVLADLVVLFLYAGGLAGLVVLLLRRRREVDG